MNKSNSKFKIKLPIIITAVISVLACATWFGWLGYISSPAYAEKHRYDDIYEMHKDDEHFVGVIDDLVWYDWDYTDIFWNQTPSGCTHDLSYTEPVIPTGKYYPNGDPSSEYYMEITNENGGYYFYDNTGKHQFIVLTEHGMGDRIFMAASWTERDFETDPYPDLWLGDKIYFDALAAEVTFDDYGNAVIDRVADGADMSDIGGEERTNLMLPEYE